MTTSLAIRTRPPQEPARHLSVGAVPLVRVRPAPPFEPPYDDEVVPAADGWGSLAGPAAGGAHRAPVEPVGEAPADETPTHGTPAHGTPTDGTPADETRTDGAPADAVPTDRVLADGTPPRIVTGRHAAHRYVSLCLEVLEGFRPVGHLRRFTVPTAFESVVDQLARPAARAGHRPGGEAAGGADSAPPPRRVPGTVGRPGVGAAERRPREGTPGHIGGGTRQAGTAGPSPRAAPGGRADAPGTGRRAGFPVLANRPSQPDVTGRATLPGPSADRIRLRRMRVAEPRDGAVEAVAVLSRAGRTWALALRLEYRDDSWLCTHVEVV